MDVLFYQIMLNFIHFQIIKVRKILFGVRYISIKEFLE